MFKDSGNDAHDNKDGTHYNPDNQTPLWRMMINSDNDDDDNKEMVHSIIQKTHLLSDHRGLEVRKQQ